MLIKAVAKCPKCGTENFVLKLSGDNGPYNGTCSKCGTFFGTNEVWDVSY